MFRFHIQVLRFCQFLFFACPNQYIKSRAVSCTLNTVHPAIRYIKSLGLGDLF